MIEYGIWSLIPPILAIILSIATRQVLFSLLVGLLLGKIIIEGNFIIGFFSMVGALVSVFENNSSTSVIIFTLLIGSLIYLIQMSKGADGFVRSIQKQFENKKHPERKLQFAASITSLFIFIESNISILTVGSTFQPLFDKYKIAREKLAYIADSVSSPICILLPINAWGGYIIGLLGSYPNTNALQLFIFSIPWNLYPILTIIMVFYLCIAGKDYGYMQKVQAKIEKEKKLKNDIKNNIIDKIELPRMQTSSGKSYNMILPILLVIITMPIFLLYTGWDSTLDSSWNEKAWIAFQNGSASLSVLYAVTIALLFAGLLFGMQKIITFQEFFQYSIKGMQEMIEIALIMLFAFAIGNLCKELGTGQYITSIVQDWLDPRFAPAIIFLTSCFVSFSTGTSWGTYAIMITIVVPLSQSIGCNPYMSLAAVLGGGVFGDHCSPISDTTVLSSMASGTTHIQHIRTQLPYALFIGVISFVMYIILGLLF